MSFKVWFRRWIRSFYRLLMIGSRPHKSEKQRKNERERRLKAKYAPPDPFKKKRKYKRRGGNTKAIAAIFGFLATSLGILLLPFGLFHWGYTSAKTRKNAKNNQRKNGTTSNTTRTTRETHKTEATHTSHDSTAQTTEKRKTGTKPRMIVAKPTPVAVPIKSKDSVETGVSYEPYTPIYERESVVTPPVPEPKELDENTPKSTPKTEKDQYIRKRMIVAGSSYCDANVLAKLHIGTYFDPSREPNNPHDKDSVVLTLDGEKIGYVARKDLTPFTVCLNLRRNIYGVITDIITENNFTKYEYETWFDSNR